MNSSTRNVGWKCAQLAQTPAKGQFIIPPMRQKAKPCMKGLFKDYTWHCGPAWGSPVMPERHQSVCTSWVLDVCGGLVLSLRTHSQDHRLVTDAKHMGGYPAAHKPQRSTIHPVSLLPSSSCPTTTVWSSVLSQLSINPSLLTFMTTYLYLNGS